MAVDGGTKAVVAALIANTGIAITKFIAFFLTGLSSMLAEAIHSVADASNQVLLLVGGKQSKRPATAQHQFGYGRERYLYAFIVSIVLFTVGGLYALYEAYHKAHEIRTGHHEDAGEWWWVPIAVLCIAIVLETLSFRTAIIETDKVRGDASYAHFIKHSKQPELPVILLEDLAALLGLVFALLAVCLSLITGNYYFDVAGTAMIGILLVVVAVLLAVETKSLLLGEAATQEAQQQILQALEATPGIERVIDMKTLHLGPEQLLVAVKFGVSAETPAGEIAAAIDAAELAIRTADPMATSIYLEPDIYRADYSRPAS
ncbi:cation diffusion facilitator family transporter [Nocardioides sp.]|uniref:cation diffusion facilitator family transporter n=1 Tax=Nocardioides sp. TaxID=35761 RepID=UPI003D130162